MDLLFAVITGLQFNAAQRDYIAIHIVSEHNNSLVYDNIYKMRNLNTFDDIMSIFLYDPEWVTIFRLNTDHIYDAPAYCLNYYVIKNCILYDQCTLFNRLYHNKFFQKRFENKIYSFYLKFINNDDCDPLLLYKFIRMENKIFRILLSLYPLNYLIINSKNPICKGLLSDINLKKWNDNIIHSR